MNLLANASLITAMCSNYLYELKAKTLKNHLTLWSLSANKDSINYNKTLSIHNVIVFNKRSFDIAPANGLHPKSTCEENYETHFRNLLLP